MRPSLIDKTKLKPKVVEVPEIVLPSITLEEYTKAELDPKSLNILLNVFILTGLTFVGLWMYNVYIDRRDVKITPLLELESDLYQGRILNYADPNNLDHMVPQNMLETPNNFTNFI